ncbi:MAG: GNAT family N-acetyltransferase [Treponema sp.]|jgi:GNAT superfamily N-acetyltransferase|nr:GNAT family N-acetyltransferase [Treponema sp.]
MQQKYHLDDHTTFRLAEPQDSALILEFVRDLAEYEKLLDAVKATEEGFKKYIFDEKKAEVIIAEYDEKPAGFALYFHTFSTFVGRPGIYLEDLFVKPEYRGKGLGKTLLTFLAKIAVDRNCGRLEWACLDWNEPSIQFYKSQGANPLSEWTTYRVSGDALADLGAKFPKELQ